MKWEDKSLDELGFVSRGRSRYRPRDAEHLYGGIYPFIQTSDVKHSGLYINSFSQTYSEEGLAQSKLWKAGTLCITIAANIADTAILEIDACFPDSIIGFIPDPNKADVRFIKYLFDAQLQRRFKQFTQGAAQDNLSQSKLLSLKLPVPSINIQNKIADILSRYDEAIANNRRRIELLERSSRLLYREWFVYLRFPGHEHGAIDPDGIPEGWEKIPLGDVLTLQRGFDLPVAKRIEGNYPIYASTGINGYHEKLKVKAPGVVTGRSGSLGTVLYASEDFWPLNTTLWVKEFKKVDPIFAVYLLRNLHLEQYNGGAAVPTLNRNDVHRINVLCPSKRLLDLFHEFSSPIYEQNEKLNISNKKLQAARDLLLPRLMNGEINV